MSELATSPWAPVTTARRSPALEILLHGPLSRAELARRLDLSPATLTRLTRPLLDSGLVSELPTQSEPRSGRPTKPLEVVATAHHFLGVRLTEFQAYAVVTNLRGDIVASNQAPLVSPDPHAVVAVVSSLVAELTRQEPDITALGACIGGLTLDQRTVRQAPLLGWAAPVALAEMIEEGTALPTVVHNDLLALTRAEHWFGEGRQLNHFAVVTIGSGVGYGLVAHDHVVDSPDAGVGFLEHFPLDPRGPLCRSGHHGCAEAMLTSQSIRARVAGGLYRDVTYDEALELALAGNAVAVTAVEDSARALGRLLAAVANISMAPTLILTGEGARLAEVGRSWMMATLASHRDPLATVPDVRVRPIRESAWARGAAVTAIQAYIQKEANGPRTFAQTPGEHDRPAG